MTSHCAPRRNPRDSSLSANWSERSWVPQGPSQRLELLLVDPEDAHVRVEHQPLADQAGRVGEPVGEPVRRREEQQTRGSDAVRAEDDDVRFLALLDALTVDVDRAGREALLVRRDLADPRAGHHLRAVLEGLRPHRRVGRALRPLRAAPHAGSGSLARCEVPDRLGANRVRRPATSASRARSCPPLPCVRVVRWEAAVTPAPAPTGTTGLPTCPRSACPGRSARSRASSRRRRSASRRRIRRASAA